MREQQTPSIYSALDDLYRHTVVIDSQGYILFANAAWNAYNARLGLSARIDWTGMNYFEVMETILLNPHLLATARKALYSIASGKHLVYSIEIPLEPVPGDSGGLVRLEAFPLIGSANSTGHSVVICHELIQESAYHSVNTQHHVNSNHHINSQHHVNMQHHINPQHHVIPLRKQQTFLPICASCKSIRDDREQWVRIEKFMQQQLSVQLTHDICPECIRQLYPQYAHVLNGTLGC
ncbi:hypothetical protein [Paenibacillus sp. sgz500958]|uniref:hypothetical protein n=1 Tax=Paenibacillus sp. sgz500958 TaxID=3242475 RepID=UPI0036D39CB1